MSVQTGRFGRALKRLTASDSELEAEDLQEEAEEAGATPCGQADQREEVCVSGRLRSVVFTPKTNMPTLEAELYDGSGSVTLIWLGRHRIAGIEPGRRLVVRGRIAQQENRRVIYNPYYEIQPPSGSGGS